MKKNISTTDKYQITEEPFVFYKDIFLDGVKALKVDKVTTTYELKRTLHPKTKQPLMLVSKKQVDEVIEHMSFDFVEVIPEELEVYRRSGIPSFVLKEDGKLYYTSIPDSIHFFSSNLIGEHRCATQGKECKRFSVLSDEMGGCAKVRNLSKRIWIYPWIVTGYETFNTKYDCFVVVKCLHYEY